VVDLFIFPSKNVTNIWAGVGAGIWAISERDDSFIRGLQTRANDRMAIGSVGVLYCSQGQFFTTPFLVYSPPQGDIAVVDVWPDNWVLPFRIHTLGSPRKRLTLDEAKKLLPIFVSSGETNAAKVLRMAPTQAFVPTEISREDWQILLQRLADDAAAH
jgi:hypothetical protein